MTRLEQIEKAAKVLNPFEPVNGWEYEIFKDTFLVGAAWADSTNKDAEMQFELTRKLKIATEALEVISTGLVTDHTAKYAGFNTREVALKALEDYND